MSLSHAFVFTVSSSIIAKCPFDVRPTTSARLSHRAFTPVHRMMHVTRRVARVRLRRPIIVCVGFLLCVGTCLVSRSHVQSHGCVLTVSLSQMFSLYRRLIDDLGQFITPSVYPSQHSAMSRFVSRRLLQTLQYFNWNSSRLSHLPCWIAPVSSLSGAAPGESVAVLDATVDAVTPRASTAAT